MSDVLRIIFAGTPDFARASLQVLLDAGHDVCAVYTQPDRPAGRGQRLSPGPVKILALDAGLPVYQPSNLSSKEVQACMRDLRADVMVVVAYGVLLPPPVLLIPRLGCVNVHASLLPRWRGAAPIQRAILAGDTRTGITIMQMDEGLDTGAILASMPCDIGPEDTAGILHDRLAAMGAQLLVNTLTQIINRAVIPVPQDERQACYAAKLDKIEARLDWSQDAIRLERAIRAFNPWPVAYTTLDTGSRLRIWQAEVIHSEIVSLPGTVLEVGQGGIDVATGSGILKLIRIQREGGRPMHVSDFQNAYRIPKGIVLGQSGGVILGTRS